VAFPRERDRLLARAAANVQDPGRHSGKVEVELAGQQSAAQDLAEVAVQAL